MITDDENHMNRWRLHALVFVLGLFVWQFARADLRLPAIVSDNMVLLQNASASVWGWADPGEQITVRLETRSFQTVADPDGNWSAKLDGLPPGMAGDITIRGKNALTIKNVAVGEVWLASGQSNMAMPVAFSKNADQEAAAADYPELRIFTVTKAGGATPQKDCVGKWEVCTPKMARHFTAVGYYFAHDLLQNLKVPVGIINASVGGTSAELWTPADVLAADPQFNGFIGGWNRIKKDYPKAKAAYDVELAKWKELAALAAKENKPAPAEPKLPRGGDEIGAPGCYYNGMIGPLLPCAIRGVIWYQGESNASNAKRYSTLFPHLIQSWRERWGIGELPFLFVQLANWNFEPVSDKGSRWAELREVQLKTLSLPHTGMAVTIDIGDAKDIHAKNKQEVGRRLALNALATVYHRDIDYSGPLFTGMHEESGKLQISFRFGNGLKTSDGKTPTGFVIAGSDQKFVPAQAEIQGEQILLQSPEIPNPKAARYAWADNPPCNIVNAAGLPASPFRTDDWRTQPAESQK